MTWTDEDELRLSIEMVLAKIKTKPRADRDGTYRRMVAEQIVAHLKRSNWQFPRDRRNRSTGSPARRRDSRGRRRPALFILIFRERKSWRGVAA